MGSFLFRWPYPADHVYVTGTFDDWGKSERLDKVEGGFEKEVQLPKADEKIYYKFVVDDQWIVDDQAPKEDDGHYNVNNVLLPHEIKKGATAAAGGDGAPEVNKEQSAADLPQSVPHVTPDPEQPGTRSLSQNDGATASQPDRKNDDVPGAFPETPANEPSSFSVTPIPATGHQNTSSSATTSKEDYENAGGEGTAGGAFGILPVLQPGQNSLGSGATASKEDYDKVGNPERAPEEQVSVSPLPATGHDNIQSSVTTLKEEYDRVGSAGPDDEQVSVKPLPATGHDDIQSSVTTSKEDYEKAGAFGTAGVAVAGAGAAPTSALSKPKDTDKSIIPESSLPMNPEKTDTMDTGPFINSAGPGTTTADLASKVPLEPKREAQVIDPSAPEAPEPSKQASATPFLASSGPGTTTADLASKVPLEQGREANVVDDETAAEKSALEHELLQKVPESQATGEPASTAKAQTSYYGLATAVPQPVEESIAKAHASPEAATESSVVAEKSMMERELQARVPIEESSGEPAPTLSAATATVAPGDSTPIAASSVPETVEESIVKAHTSPEAAAEASVVAEKSAMERELQAKVPIEESAGQPAPTFSAATATTAPGESSTAAATAASITDGKTANEPVPDTDTSTQHQGLSAGEIAGGAAVGGAAAAGAAALAAKHENRDVEPPRVDNGQKPPVTTEAAPATIHDKTEPVPNTTAGVGLASPHPGVSPTAGAALSDGTEDPTVADEPSAPRSKVPVETSEATATEYAPPRAGGMAPGVSPSAAAALSDGTEDPTLSEEPTLAEEPAVRMMAQNEAGTTSTSPAYDAATLAASTSAAPIATDTTTLATVHDATTSGTTTIAPPTSDATATPIAPSQDATTSAVATSAAPTSETTSSAPKLPPTLTSAGTTSEDPATSAASETTKAKEGEPTSASGRDTSPMTRPGESSAAAKAPETPKKTVAGPAAAGTTPSSAASTPARSTTESTATGDKKKKKRNRLSQIFKKIFD